MHNSLDLVPQASDPQDTLRDGPMGPRFQDPWLSLWDSGGIFWEDGKSLNIFRYLQALRAHMRALNVKICEASEQLIFAALKFLNCGALDQSWELAHGRHSFRN